MVTHPRGGATEASCARWLQGVLARGDTVCIPEIADYELRRELLRAKPPGGGVGVIRLDALIGLVDYLPITTAIMRTAAELWARARSSGQRTAPDLALDGDVILAATVLDLESRVGAGPVIATTNVKHLATLVRAQLWSTL
jgi:predicted nucleic acid-binding protein